MITGEESEDVEGAEKEDGLRIGGGFVASSADLFIATPIDVLFLILPALTPKSAKNTKQHFLAFDEHLDTLLSSSRHWKTLISQYPSLTSMIEKRMRVVCDTVAAGDENMYRVSHDKLFEILMKKAERMVKNGLPPSLEEKFIKTALEVPVMNIKREDSSLSAISATDSTSRTENSTPATEVDSQTSTSTSLDSQISVSTAPSDTPQPTLTTPPSIPHALRLRTSITYLLSTYLPPTLSTTLQPFLTPHFALLTTHLAAIAKLKSEAAALRSISDNMSRKRAIEEDDDKMAEREEKKRKKDEEDKKKKAEGRGVKMLKKVDTSGMKKMSAFFTKVPKKV